MDKILVLGDRDLVTGFKLVGVREGVICSQENADAKLSELLQRSDAGIIIFQDEFYGSLTHKTKKLIETVPKPVVVNVGVKAASSTENLQAMIKRAIGISLDKL
ncbi:MAG TPA: V-type ATP synthase subunit F [Candidatus Norongarragalinales archaeon]|nr:V-type ATP synthase subunit F [Candidatus Norongarragalinales archaeon]